MADSLSTVAVPSLSKIFTACVQRFNDIRNGRRSERDVVILATKFSNQQLRFTKWGEACGFGSSLGYNTALDGPETRPHIELTLQRIEDLLDSGVSIASQYMNNTSQSQVTVRTGTASTNWSRTAVRDQLQRSQQVRDSKEATNWAFSDKEKLDDIIKQLHDLVGNLENLTKDLEIPDLQRILVQSEIQSILDAATLELMEASRVTYSDMIADTASMRLQSLQSSSPSLSRQRGHTGVPSNKDTEDTGKSRGEDAGNTMSNQESLITHEMQSLSIVEAPPTRDSDSVVSRSTVFIDTSLVGKSIRKLCLDEFDALIADWIPTLHRNDRTSNNRRSTRVMIEVGRFEKDHETEFRWFNLHPIGDDLRFILGSFEGPQNTPYEGGMFHLVFFIPSDYPFKPPRCQFLTKVYHPNINSDGITCIDIMNHMWTPSLTIFTLLLSVASILDDPGLEDPLIREIADLHYSNPELYEVNARRNTREHASEVNLTREMMQKCIKLCVGFAEEEEETHIQ